MGIIDFKTALLGSGEKKARYIRGLREKFGFVDDRRVSDRLIIAKEDRERRKARAKDRQMELGFKATKFKLMSYITEADEIDTTRLREAFAASVGAERVTALGYFARAGNVKMYDELVRAGADVNERANFRADFRKKGLKAGHRLGGSGRTALQIVIEPQDDDPSAIGFLVRRGADVNAASDDGWTPLFYAVHYQLVKTTEELLRAGADVNKFTNDGNNPLDEAVAYIDGSLEIIQMLLDAGAEVDPIGKGTISALSTTMFNCAKYDEFYRFDILKKLIRYGANPSRALLYFLTNLTINTCSISESHKKQILNYLLYKGADVNFVDTEREEKSGIEARPLLGFICGLGNCDLAEWLISRGAKIDGTDANGVTALMYASSYGLDDVISLLLRHGARIDFWTYGNATALLCAIANNQIDTVRTLMDAGADPDIPETGAAVLLALQNNNSKIYRLLVEEYELTDWNHEYEQILVQRQARILAARQREVREKAKQEKKEAEEWKRETQQAYSRGWTEVVNLLDIAKPDYDIRGVLNNFLLKGSEAGNAQVVKGCLDRGAEINCRDRAGDTALIRALKKNNGVVNILVRAGANVNQRGDKDYAPLHWAAIHGDTDTVNLLLRHGAELDATIDGKTAFMFALFLEKYDMATALLSAGANPTYRDEKGRTALMIAATCGTADLVETLISKGVDVNARDTQGRTAIMYAAAEGNADIVTTLYLGGANVKLRNRNKETAFDVARAAGHKGIVSLLSQL